jgi:hypothetical protein
MDAVFIDQNKWIDLGRVEAGKITSGTLVVLYEQLAEAVDRGRVIFPLTISHILETSKRNDPTSRTHVAAAQARLSKGYVFRSRKARLLIEMRFALQRLFGEIPLLLPDNWAIVPGFTQAFELFDQMVASPTEAERSRLLNQQVDPREQFLGFMLNQNESSRRAAHSAFVSESASLVARIEKRRRLLNGQTVDLRRRAYAAMLFHDHQGYVAQVLESIGHTVEEMKAKGAEAMVAFLQNVPTLNVEVEMAARLESQTGDIKQNDIRDMLSFYTAIPYASHIIAEKAFISLARQSKLDAQYKTSLSQKLESLLGAYN